MSMSCMATMVISISNTSHWLVVASQFPHTTATTDWYSGTRLEADFLNMANSKGRTGL